MSVEERRKDLRRKAERVAKAFIKEFRCVMCNSTLIVNVCELNCMHLICKECIPPKRFEKCPKCRLPVTDIVEGSCQAQSYVATSPVLEGLLAKRAKVKDEQDRDVNDEKQAVAGPSNMAKAGPSNMAKAGPSNMAKVGPSNQDRDQSMIHTRVLIETLSSSEIDKLSPVELNNLLEVQTTENVSLYKINLGKLQREIKEINKKHSDLNEYVMEEIMSKQRRLAHREFKKEIAEINSYFKTDDGKLDFSLELRYRDVAKLREKIAEFRSKFELLDFDMDCNTAEDGESEALKVRKEIADLNNNRDLLDDEAAEMAASGVPFNIKMNIKVLNSKGETVLHTASSDGQITRMRSLIKEGANVNARDFNGWTPLHEAAIAGHQLAVSVLLDAGALVNVGGGTLNSTALHEAVSRNYLGIIKRLIGGGASTSVRDRKGREPGDLTDSPTIKCWLCKAGQIPVGEQNFDLVEQNMPSPMRMYTYNLTPENQALVDQYKSQLHLTNTLSRSVSHIILETSSGLCDTSVVYLKGLLMGVQFLSAHWIREFVGHLKKLRKEPLPQMVLGSKNFPTGAPCRAFTNANHLLPKLFDGCHFYIRGFRKPYQYHDDILSKDTIIELIEMGGGKVLKRQPRESIPEEEQLVPYHADSKGPMARCSHIILYCDGDTDIRYNMTHLKALPIKWLLDSIESFTVAAP